MRLTFDSGATKLLNDFRTIEEKDLLPGGRLAYMEDWGGKFAGAVVRIAGLIHCARHAHEEIPRMISADTMRDAIEIGEYYICQALAVFDLMGADPLIDDARHILEWISSQGLSEFTARDLFQALRGRFRAMPSVWPALAVLIQHGYLALEATDQPQGRGRPASPGYFVNPNSFTHNTQKYSCEA